MLFLTYCLFKIGIKVSETFLITPLSLGFIDQIIRQFLNTGREEIIRIFEDNISYVYAEEFVE